MTFNGVLNRSHDRCRLRCILRLRCQSRPPGSLGPPHEGPLQTSGPKPLWALLSTYMRTSRRFRILRESKKKVFLQGVSLTRNAGKLYAKLYALLQVLNSYTFSSFFHHTLWVFQNSAVLFLLGFDLHASSAGGKKYPVYLLQITFPDLKK